MGVSVEKLTGIRMIWLAFAILTAFFESLKDVFSKHRLRKTDEYIVTWVSIVFSALFLILLLLLTKIPLLSFQFWIALLIGDSLNMISFTLYTKAIKASDLLLTVPIVTLTPLFLLVTSPLIVHKYPALPMPLGFL
ncbi:EamA family transporter [Phormidesmis priestleyi]